MFGCSSDAASRASALKRAHRIGVLRVLGRDDLERDGPVELFVGRAIDHAHPAALQQALDAVAREDRARLESCQALIGLFHDATSPARPWTPFGPMLRDDGPA